MQQAGLIIGILGGILGAVGVVASIILGVMTWRYTKHKDVVQEAGAGAGLQIDIEYIKRGVDDIKIEQRATRENFGRLSERVARVEGRLEDHINMHPPDR
jgi:hypothetical protein